MRDGELPLLYVSQKNIGKINQSDSVIDKLDEKNEFILSHNNGMLTFEITIYTGYQGTINIYMEGIAT